MKIPISAEYLSLAIKDGHQTKVGMLRHRYVGDLQLPTGRLVACDPFVCPDLEPFSITLQSGVVPVVLSIAHIKTDQRVAFASLLLNDEAPTNWELMIVGNQKIAALKDGEIFGYPVDSGTGCFMDRSAHESLNEKMRADPDYYETMLAEMEKTYINTWSWLNLAFDRSNLIGFSSGYGDGVYATYAGYGADGKLSKVVTDFCVVR